MTGPRPSPPAATIVVKIGSSSLTMPEGGLSVEGVGRVVRQVSEAWRGGRRVVLVSSGAVAAGLPALGLTGRPKDVPGLQVAAAVGQSRLMEQYTRAFSAQGLIAGQVLLTKDILANRNQYLHARQALERMLAEGVVPIVNENDTVVVDELRMGDNDRLAAVVSHLVDAKLLIILTDTWGLYTEDPRFSEQAALLSAVRHTDEILDQVVGGSSGPLGSGGVATKVAAARMAAWSGIPTVIGSSHEPDLVERAISGSPVGTWVEPNSVKLPARKLWIAFGQPSMGRLIIDEGAVAALVERGTSLLAVGVRSFEGDFDTGSAVEVYDGAGGLLAKGLVEITAQELDTALSSSAIPDGLVVVHRDQLVLLRVASATGYA